MRVTRASAALSESGFMGFSGFRSAQTANPAKQIADKRTPVADALARRILKIP